MTSRLLPMLPPTPPTPRNEALLLIDEPGSGLPGFGPSLQQVLCTTPLLGCAATVEQWRYRHSHRRYSWQPHAGSQRV